MYMFLGICFSLLFTNDGEVCFS